MQLPRMIQSRPRRPASAGHMEHDCSLKCSSVSVEIKWRLRSCAWVFGRSSLPLLPSPSMEGAPRLSPVSVSMTAQHLRGVACGSALIGSPAMTAVIVTAAFSQSKEIQCLGEMSNLFICLSTGGGLYETIYSGKQAGLRLDGQTSTSCLLPSLGGNVEVQQLARR